jgi:hypothetical protein
LSALLALPLSLIACGFGENVADGDDDGAQVLNPADDDSGAQVGGDEADDDSGAQVGDDEIDDGLFTPDNDDTADDDATVPLDDDTTVLPVPDDDTIGPPDDDTIPCECRCGAGIICIPEENCLCVWCLEDSDCPCNESYCLPYCVDRVCQPCVGNEGCGEYQICKSGEEDGKTVNECVSSPTCTTEKNYTQVSGAWKGKAPAFMGEGDLYLLMTDQATNDTEGSASYTMFLFSNGEIAWQVSGKSYPGDCGIFFYNWKPLNVGDTDKFPYGVGSGWFCEAGFSGADLILSECQHSAQDTQVSGQPKEPDMITLSKIAERVPGTDVADLDAIAGTYLSYSMKKNGDLTEYVTVIDAAGKYSRTYRPRGSTEEIATGSGDWTLAGGRFTFITKEGILYGEQNEAYSYVVTDPHHRMTVKHINDNFSMDFPDEGVSNRCNIKKDDDTGILFIYDCEDYAPDDWIQYLYLQLMIKK